VLREALTADCAAAVAKDTNSSARRHISKVMERQGVGPHALTVKYRHRATQYARTQRPATDRQTNGGSLCCDGGTFPDEWALARDVPGLASTHGENWFFSPRWSWPESHERNSPGRAPRPIPRKPSTPSPLASGSS
jgi:hypothetical protein